MYELTVPPIPLKKFDKAWKDVFPNISPRAFFKDIWEERKKYIIQK